MKKVSQSTQNYKWSNLYITGRATRRNSQYGGGYNNACGAATTPLLQCGGGVRRWQQCVCVCVCSTNQIVCDTQNATEKKPRYGIIKPSAPLRVTEA